MELSHATLPLAGLVLLLSSGCTTVAQVTTLSDETCHHKMRDQLETILSEEGEQPDVANRLAVNTTLVLAHGRWALAHSGFHPHRVSIIVFSSNGKATNASFGSLAVRRGLLAAQIT